MKKITYESTIKCPACGCKQLEKMPHGSCCSKECTCKKCGCAIKAQANGCCVYCACGDTCCPSAQQSKDGKCPCIG